MITREQRQELTNMALQAKFKVVARGAKITISSKCATLTFSNDENGYKSAKKRLEEMSGEAKPDISNIIELAQMCRAVIWLNSDGDPAGAREQVVGTGYCKSTKFMCLPDGQEVCASCWTLKPAKGEIN